jgi:hypothetical protein
MRCTYALYTSGRAPAEEQSTISSDVVLEGLSAVLAEFVPGHVQSQKIGPIHEVQGFVTKMKLGKLIHGRSPRFRQAVKIADAISRQPSRSQD